jgi:hypothetical protein
MIKREQRMERAGFGRREAGNGRRRQGERGKRGERREKPLRFRFKSFERNGLFSVGEASV